MYTISEVISKLIQSNKVEKPVFIRLYHRNSDGDVLKSERFPISAVFSHKEDCAEIVIEQSNMETT